MTGCFLSRKKKRYPSALVTGPEFDSDSPGCPQFHFMPRFVRFLPGKTPHTLIASRPLVVSADTALSPNVKNIIFTCKVHYFDSWLESTVRHPSTWGCCCSTITSARVVMTAVPPTFSSIKKTISLLLPPPLLQFSLLQTLMYLFYKNPSKNQNSKPVRWSDETSKESESRQSSSDGDAVLDVADASRAERGLIYSTFISRLYPISSTESRP